MRLLVMAPAVVPVTRVDHPSAARRQDRRWHQRAVPPPTPSLGQDSRMAHRRQATAWVPVITGRIPPAAAPAPMGTRHRLDWPPVNVVQAKSGTCTIRSWRTRGGGNVHLRPRRILRLLVDDCGYRCCRVRIDRWWISTLIIRRVSPGMPVGWLRKWPKHLV